MALRKKQSDNWKTLKNQSYQEQSKNRDVHTMQDMARGKRQEIEKPVKEHILSVFVGLLFGVLGYIVGRVLIHFFTLYQYILANPGQSFFDYSGKVDIALWDWRLLGISGLSFGLAYLVSNQKLLSGLKARNSMADGTDINTYENDQHIMLREEMLRTFDYFPDTGAESSVQVTSMLSHVMLDKKGLKKVDFTKRHGKKNKEGVPAGTPVTDEDGNVVMEHVPIIDSDFGQELFTASGIPVSEKGIRTPVDVRNIEYNPFDESGSRSNRDKLEYDTVADLINGDWEIPDYEFQRPAGAYLVDTAPLNTMVLAITRAGKGNGARFVW